MASAAEQTAMRRALVLAAAVLGTTNPNPAVGAVVLDELGQPVGEGATAPVRGDHAEVVALAAAGPRARGGSLVVSLEPCRHTGRTGPCTAVILAAGVARVVYAVADPNVRARGGADELRRGGVEVESGLLAPDAGRLLEPWLASVARRRPYVTWKYAASLDGRTAAADGTSRWITGPVARADVHRERALADAVMVGIGTVLADDPELTVRDWPTNRQPVRIVVDSAARTPLHAKVFSTAALTILAVATDVDQGRVEALRSTGAEVVGVRRDRNGLDPGALLSALFDLEVHNVWLEGGATLAGSFVGAGLVDRVVGYYAPLLLGAGAPLVGDLGSQTLETAQRLAFDDVVRVGEDLKLVARVCHHDAEGLPG